MPYIAEKDRVKQVTDVIECESESLQMYSEYQLNKVLDALIDHIRAEGGKKGTCNYIVSRLVAGGMMPEEGWGYDSISNARACLLDAGLELGRRLMDGYEDSCIERNGDIPEYENPKFKNSNK